MEIILAYGYVPVKTSNELREQLKSELMKNKFPSKEKIIKMVDDKIIIPIEAINNKYYMLLLKLIGKDKIITNFFGFHYKGKIYIIYNDTFKEFRNPVRITIHECVHYIAETKKKEFYSINFNILLDFYSLFFKDYLQLKDVNEKVVSLFLENLIKEESSSMKFLPVENKYNKIIDILKPLMMYSNLTQEEYKNKLDSIKIYNSLARKSAKFGEHENLINIIRNLLQKVYMKVFNINVNVVRIKIEFSVPSEIICKLAEFKFAHPNIIKTLKLL